MKRIFLLSAIMFLTTAALTQTPAPSTPTNMFVGESDAMGLHYNNAWTVGAISIQDLDLMDFGKTKTQHIYIEGKQLIGTEAGINAFTGGIKFQPDFSNLLNKTNISSDNFGAYFTASCGVGNLDAGGQHIAYMFGGGIQYRATTLLSWQPLQVQWLRIGDKNVAAISSGLSFVFGQKQ